MTARQNCPRPAALSPRALNVLILVWAVLIGAVYVIGLLNRGRDRGAFDLTTVLWISILFAVLDALVIARLRRFVVEVITRRATGTAKALLGLLAFAGLCVAVVVFFFATCFAMVQGF